MKYILSNSNCDEYGNLGDLDDISGVEIIKINGKDAEELHGQCPIFDTFEDAIHELQKHINHMKEAFETNLNVAQDYINDIKPQDLEKY